MTVTARAADTAGPVAPRPHRAAGAVSLVLFFLVAGLVPLGLHAVNRAAGTSHLPESYLPSVVPPRARQFPFFQGAIDGFRQTSPAFVVIGDSMAGSRINHRLLGRIANAGVVPVFEAASGSVYWYLAFKNWVVASGTRPRAVIFFFRDENLTDPMFRLSPRSLDQVAHDSEPELNDILAAHSQGAFFRVHALLRDAYGYDRTRAWLEPILARAPVPLAAPPPHRAELLERMNRELFSLAALRPMAAADMAFGDPEKFEFRKNLPHSVLPEIIRLARQIGTQPAFIRVQRRPVNGRPPEQSEALLRYMRELRAYLAANGAYFYDEWGDRELPLSLYSDGDHIRRDHIAHTTELFYRRNPGLFQ